MDFKYYTRKFNDSKFQKWTMRIALIALAIVVIYQSVEIHSLSSNSKTIILPPRTPKAFYVSGGYVSKGYAIDMGQYLSQTLLDLSPANYREQLALFMQFVGPSEFNGIKLSLLKQFRALAKLQVSQSFFPGKITVKKGFIYVQGTLMWYMGNNKTKVFNKILKIGFKIKNGEFYVESVSFKKNRV